jgi:hypothetical protein
MKLPFKCAGKKRKNEVLDIGSFTKLYIYREHHEVHSHSAVQKNTNSVKVKADGENPVDDPKKAHGIC